MRFAVIALGIWLAIEGSLAVWIYSSPREPEPMGYWGTFCVFSIIASGIYLVLAIPAAIGHYFLGDTRPGGFPIEGESQPQDANDPEIGSKTSN